MRDGRKGDGKRPPRSARPVSSAPRPEPRSPVQRPPVPRARQQADEPPDAREVRLYGINACLGCFARRRDGIVRAYFTAEVARRHFGALMKWLAAQRLAYHLVSDEELDRITGSTHHEGVCLLVRVDAPAGAGDWLARARPARESCVLALENVGNPHNLGAILRIAAHFGAPAVMVPDARALAGGAAVRTAEGGAEFVEVLDAPDFAACVRAFREAGWQVVATSSHGGDDVFRTKLPARCLLLFGEESAGLSADMQASADRRVRIPGTGRVESLNVGVAAGILLAEWWRQHSALPKGTGSSR